MPKTEPIDSFTGPKWWLSNFFPVMITIEGKTYRTTEHAFQAMKTLDEFEREGIRLETTPGRAKRRGNNPKTCTLRADWESIKDDYMLQVTRLKFAKDKPILRAMLLNTGDAHLEEGNNWGDKYWGTVDGEGLNVLGVILMRVRMEIREDIEYVHVVTARGPWPEKARGVYYADTPEGLEAANIAKEELNTKNAPAQYGIFPLHLIDAEAYGLVEHGRTSDVKNKP